MATKIQTSLKDDPIICQALTFGYLLDIENELVEESKIGIILDGTDLNEAEIRSLRVPEVTKLINAIKKETYPELYNDDGTMKEFNDSLDDKKKV